MIISEMKDSEGNVLKTGDIVKILVSAPFNKSLRKNNTYRISYIENRGFPIAFLSGKNNPNYVYHRGFTSNDLLKV